ncbi:MAG: tetratricopeptide repeat protein [Reichenbachiella sp.]|uniref:tetratricopeptide repeat protein n=1 Tax=Reichenbachiella sp. TaxID=2184521 RepID=UPI0032650EC2
MRISIAIFVSLLLSTTVSNGQGLEGVFKKLLKEDIKDTLYVDSILTVAKNFNKSQPIEAIEYFKKAKLIAEEIEYDQGVLAAINGIGNGHIITGNYEEALRFHQLLLTESQALDDKNHILIALGNLAITYASLLDYDKSLDYFRQSLFLARQTNHQKVGSICGNLGNLFKIREDYDSAMHYLNLAITFGIENDNHRALAFGLLNLSDVKVHLSRYEEALLHIDSALVCGKMIESELFEINGQVSRIEVLKAMGQGVKYIPDLKEYLKIAEDNLYYQALVTGYALLSDLLIESGRPNEAMSALKKRYEWENQVFNSEKSKKIEQLTAQFELDRKQREIDIQNLRITKQTYFIYIVSGIAILTLLIALVLYRYFITKSRANEKLEALNQQITEHQVKLVNQSNSLKHANEEINNINSNLEKIIEERTQMIKAQNEKLLEYAFLSAHEIRGPLSSILGLTQMLKEHPDDKSLMSITTQLHDKSADMDFVIKKMVTSLEEEIQLRPINKRPTT